MVSGRFVKDSINIINLKYALVLKRTSLLPIIISSQLVAYPVQLQFRFPVLPAKLNRRNQIIMQSCSSVYMTSK